MKFEDENDSVLQAKDREIADLKEKCTRFRKDIDEKNEFLSKLGITCPSEMKRIDRYIDEFRNENAKLRQQVRNKEQEKLMLQIALDNVKDLIRDRSMYNI